MFSNADVIAILENIRSEFFKLLPIDKSTIGTAFVTQDIVAILVVDSGMPSRGEFILRE